MIDISITDTGNKYLILIFIGRCFAPRTKRLEFSSFPSERVTPNCTSLIKFIINMIITNIKIHNKHILCLYISPMKNIYIEHKINKILHKLNKYISKTLRFMIRKNPFDIYTVYNIFIIIYIWIRKKIMHGFFVLIFIFVY